MEFLAQLLVYAVGAYVAYFIADKVKTSKPSINVEPVLYAAGSVLFGFLWVMLFLAIKLALYNNKNK